ncbi:MAG: hypothetical protein DDT25_01003 [Chloroflexi bacterium]|nr:hypothetical protein [Chloroflexota bacterium]
MAKMFVQGRCPVCGWELSPKQWRRQRGDDFHLGQSVQALGFKGFAYSPLMRVEDMEFREPGLVGVVSARLTAAVGRWVRMRVISLRDVLNSLPVHYLGGGMWVEDFERVGRRPIERAAVDFDMAGGKSQVLYQREIKPVAGREVSSYGW